MLLEAVVDALVEVGVGVLESDVIVVEVLEVVVEVLEVVVVELVVAVLVVEVLAVEALAQVLVLIATMEGVVEVEDREEVCLPFLVDDEDVNWPYQLLGWVKVT